MEKHQSDFVEHYHDTPEHGHECTDYSHRSWWHILRHELDWSGVLIQGSSHLLALWGVCRLLLYGFVSYRSILFTYILSVLTGIGSLAGAHRYFSHRAFKAHWLFKLFLLYCQTLSGQRSAVRWAREHRTHHKYSGTDADCVNINRGFFFAHMGWLLMKPHPECEKRLNECNVSDLLDDPMIRFQYDHYTPLMLMCNVVIPTLVPFIYFGEGLLDSFLWVFALRYVYTLHVAFSGNSVLHLFGSKPYDQRSSATHCTWMIWATMGAAYHNFHHTFPYDYSASEFGPSRVFNLNTVIIDLCAKIGLAHDLKRASPDTISRWKHKYGDPEEAIPKRSAWLDWTLGLWFSALPIWLILAARMLVLTLSSLQSTY